MNTINLIVNGETRQAQAEPRTQLAEVLRDRLQLTGTHLGCEQGVCGACTVLVDGKPIRSCITYAAACDGARVETIEGFRDDPIMSELRRAFSEHHALQCGFCTPGMIITARDIVLRMEEADEARIRHELSGNLCRCTGYVGIVAAIVDVIGKRDRGSFPAVAAPSPSTPARPAALASFAVSDESPAIASQTSSVASSRSSVTEEWTSIVRRFELPHPLAEVQPLFEDLRRVARCIPGASIGAIEGEAFTGGVTIKFGPIHASFLGEGRRRLQSEAAQGAIEARGKDASGQSSARGRLTYRLSATDENRATAVDVELRFQIQGLLAQFNRADLVESFVEIVLKQFAANCDAILAGRGPEQGSQLNAISLLVEFIKIKLRAFFQKRRA